MKIRDFFRNLKAGLKFVLHTGQLVNNGLCNEPGKYPLDAAYGRTLLEMIGNTADLPGGAADIVSAIVTQNSNLKEYYSLKNAITIPRDADLNDYTDFGNYVCTSGETAATLINCPANKGGFVLHVERSTGSTDGNFLKQRIIYNSLKSLEFWRVKSGGGTWGEWISPITNADFITKTVTLNQVTVPANAGITGSTTNISSQIPSGYKILDARELGSGNNGCYIYYFKVDGANITTQLRNVTNTAITTSPAAQLLLIPK